MIAISEIPIRIFDTAGLRDACNQIEQDGIKRTEKIIKSANLILFIVDASIGFAKEDLRLIEKYSRITKVLTVWNKTDIESTACPDSHIPICAKAGSGLDILNNRIEKMILNNSSLKTGEPVIDSIRQRDLLKICLTSLKSFQKGKKEGMPLDILAVDIKDAIDALGEITGEVTQADILDKIFSSFCVGK